MNNKVLCFEYVMSALGLWRGSMKKKKKKIVAGVTWTTHGRGCHAFNGLLLSMLSQTLLFDFKSSE